MTLLEALAPIDLPAFKECFGIIDGWGVTIAKTSQEPASPAWVMPDEFEPSLGSMRPWCWRSNLDAQVKRLRSLMDSNGLEECDCNLSFPLDGVAYTLTVTLRRVKDEAPEDAPDVPSPECPPSDPKERSIRRLQKRAAGGQ